MTGGDARVFGDVFEKSIDEVWDSMLYQEARRFTSDLISVARDPALKNHFCDGCFVVLDTTMGAETVRWGDKHRWESVFTKDESAPVVRRPQAKTGLPS